MATATTAAAAAARAARTPARARRSVPDEPRDATEVGFCFLGPTPCLPVSWHHDVPLQPLQPLSRMQLSLASGSILLPAGALVFGAQKRRRIARSGACWRGHGQCAEGQFIAASCCSAKANHLQQAARLCHAQEPARKRHKVKTKRGAKGRRRRALRNTPSDVWAAIFKQLPDLERELPKLRLVCRQVQPSIIMAISRSVRLFL